MTQYQSRNRKKAGGLHKNFSMVSTRDYASTATKWNVYLAPGRVQRVHCIQLQLNRPAGLELSECQGHDRQRSSIQKPRH